MPPARPILKQDGEQFSKQRAGPMKGGGSLSCRAEAGQHPEQLRSGEDAELHKQSAGEDASVELPSDSNNVLDQLKELEQARLESERDLCIFSGALDFLRGQLSNVNGSQCPVCYRDCTGSEQAEVCRQQIKQKIEETEQAREKLNLVDIHNSCIRTLAKVRKPGYSDKQYQPRVAFNTRNGALTELRNQKVECLISKKCFACRLPFSYSESAQFLSRIDHKASSMEKELHVHT